MELDRERRALCFANDEELASFHRELTALLREVTISVSAASADAAAAKAGSREVLREYRTVTRVLNALRKHARGAKEGAP